MEPTGTSDLAPAAPVTPWMYGLRAYQRDQPRFFQHLVERYGDVVHWRLGQRLDPSALVDQVHAAAA